MSATTPESLGHYHGREPDLTQELIAYFRLAAASLSDPDQLEALLDDLCAAEDAQITGPQVAARVGQIQYVRNLLRERTRVEALEESRSWSNRIRTSSLGSWPRWKASRSMPAGSFDSPP